MSERCQRAAQPDECHISVSGGAFRGAGDEDASVTLHRDGVGDVLASSDGNGQNAARSEGVVGRGVAESAHSKVATVPSCGAGGDRAFIEIQSKREGEFTAGGGELAGAAKGGVEGTRIKIARQGLAPVDCARQQ